MAESKIKANSVLNSAVELKSQRILKTDSLPISIYIPNPTQYRALYVCVIFDSNNGGTIYIPRELYNVRIPYYITSQNNNFPQGSGYSGYIQGEINLNISTFVIKYLNTGEWAGVDINIYGIA